MREHSQHAQLEYSDSVYWITKELHRQLMAEMYQMESACGIAGLEDRQHIHV